MRKQGYALVVDELEVGLCSIAVPIHDRALLVFLDQSKQLEFLRRWRRETGVLK